MSLPPRNIVQEGPEQELLIALRGLISRNPCAVDFGLEALAELLHREGQLSYPVAGHEVEGAVEALTIEGEVFG